MSTPIEAAFEEWYGFRKGMTAKLSAIALERMCKQAFTAGFDLAAKANTELIKEYQETMERKNK